MTDQPVTEEQTLAAPKRKPFRRKFTTVRLSPESAARQSQVTLLAWKLLGSEAAIAFLNTHHDGLEGRPLDLAVASAAGCEAVERAINAAAAVNA
jgi:uncharacterized protein (DUF2384 family)